MCKDSESDGCEAFTLLPTGECILYPRPGVEGKTLSCIENKTAGINTYQNQAPVLGCDFISGITFRDFNNTNFNITSVPDIDSPEDCRDVCSSNFLLDN